MKNGFVVICVPQSRFCKEFVESTSEIEAE